MGKNPNRAAAAARAAEMRAAAARKEKQRKQMITAGVAVVVVIIAVVVGMVIANRPQQTTPAASGSASAALSKLTALPAATLDAAPAPSDAQTRAPKKLDGATPLTQDGKPKVIYVGAEYCPFCAMERWPLIAALSRFGTFEGLKGTTSASNESIPDIPTWSFVDSTYKSDYLSFQAVETQTRDFQPLQTLEGDAKTLFEKYNPQGGIPWVNFGGTHATDGATVDAEAFRGATYDSLIAGVLDPKSPVGATVDPAINVITAQLCLLTQGQPTNVCTSKAVTAAEPLLSK